VPPDDDDHKRPRLGHRTTGCSRFLFLKLGSGQKGPPMSTRSDDENEAPCRLAVPLGAPLDHAILALLDR
jgi:hypothetical protein